MTINPNTGKNFMHLAVENGAMQILAYLMIDQQMNVN